MHDGVRHAVNCARKKRPAYHGVRQVRSCEADSFGVVSSTGVGVREVTNMGLLNPCHHIQHIQRPVLRTAMLAGCIGSVVLGLMSWAWWHPRLIPEAMVIPSLEVTQVVGLILWVVIPILTGMIAAVDTVGTAETRRQQGSVAGMLAMTGATVSSWMLGLCAWTCRSWVDMAEQTEVPDVLVPMLVETTTSVFWMGNLMLLVAWGVGPLLGTLGASMVKRPTVEGIPEVLEAEEWGFAALLGVCSGVLATLAIVFPLSSLMEGIANIEDVSVASRTAAVGGLIGFMLLTVLTTLGMGRGLLQFRTEWMRAPGEAMNRWNTVLEAGSAGTWLSAWCVVLTIWPSIYVGSAAAILTVGLIEPFTTQVTLGPEAMGPISNDLVLLTVSPFLTFLVILWPLMWMARELGRVMRRRSS